MCQPLPDKPAKRSDEVLDGYAKKFDICPVENALGVQDVVFFRRHDHTYGMSGLPKKPTTQQIGLLRRLTEKKIGRERVRRLMRRMGLEAVYPRKKTTIPGGPSGISPYHLRGLDINRPNQVEYVPISRIFQCDEDLCTCSK